MMNLRPMSTKARKLIDYGEDGLAIYADGSKQENEAETTTFPVATEGGREESFGGHTYIKKFGSTSVGMDVHFHGE